MISFDDLKSALIDISKKYLPDEFIDSSEMLVDMHLSLDTLSMPNMGSEQITKVQHLLLDGADLAEVKGALDLEDGSNPNGMFRVLARTHLNRSGMNDISMGSQNKTLSPRILEPASEINLDFSIKELEAQKHILGAFNKMAFDSVKHNDISRRCDEDSRRSLDNIYKFVDAGNDLLTFRSAHVLSKQVDCQLNWARIILGLISGLNFLQSKNWACFQEASEDQLNAENVLHLIKTCKEQVVEFGTALAGSFYADLGGARFVKDDTHVRQCAEACGLNLSVNQRVEWVINEADRMGVPPRILDKIFYTAGSGKFNLVGIEFEHPHLAKTEFLNFLRK